MSDSAHTTTPGWEGTTEVDERWFQAWVDYGIDALGRMLHNQSRFDAWRLENGR